MNANIFRLNGTELQTGGTGWTVAGGRRDGLVSNIAEPLLNLPNPNMTVPLLLPVFEAKGMNAAQMVALSGSHTIGVAHCQFVTDRLYPTTDPTLPADMATSIKAACPSAAGTASLDIDQVTPATFDTSYFDNIISGRGLLASDQVLLGDSTTSAEVTANAGSAFGGNFGRAMVVMARFDMLTGSVGQIRTNCRQVL